GGLLLDVPAPQPEHLLDRRLPAGPRDQAPDGVADEQGDYPEQPSEEVRADPVADAGDLGALRNREARRGVVEQASPNLLREARRLVARLQERAWLLVLLVSGLLVSRLGCARLLVAPWLLIAPRLLVLTWLRVLGVARLLVAAACLPSLVGHGDPLFPCFAAEL